MSPNLHPHQYDSRSLRNGSAFCHVQPLVETASDSSSGGNRTYSTTPKYIKFPTDRQAFLLDGTGVQEL